MRSIFERARYKVFYGGRGSSKSHTVARYLLVRALQTPVRVLCTREYQSSISDSVFKLLSDLISALKLSNYFTVTRSTITSVVGSEFIFAGLAQHIESIKSYEGVDIAWVEEAATVSEHSLDTLIPTIRKPGSELIFTFNPRSNDDPVYARFILTDHPDCIKKQVNYYDNPWFPDVLRQEMAWMKATDYDKYEHVWEGKVLKHSAAQIFKNKFVVEEFDAPDETTFFFGVDFGFSSDPACCVRCFMRDGYLYVDYEVYGHNLELPDLVKLIRSVPGVAHGKIYADNSRPESIAYIAREHLNIWPCDKWKNSVEEGIEYIRSFKGVKIHPRCKNTIYEFTNYSYKVDKVTNDVLPIIVDKDNHTIDSLRYALNAYIKKTATIFDSGVI